MGLLGLSLIVASLIAVLVRLLWRRQLPVDKEAKDRLAMPPPTLSPPSPRPPVPRLVISQEEEAEGEEEGVTTPRARSPALRSRQVALAPGHSPLDWARLMASGADLRGPVARNGYMRVTPTMLRHHAGRRGADAWIALGGRVYNASAYLAFHPGGEPELLRGAGRDALPLFNDVHPWVNYETMLAACLIGPLVNEPLQAGGGGALEEMD